MKFALEVHPSEIAYDFWTTKRALDAINHRPAFGFNFDPSHLYWQMMDPVEFVYEYGDRIYHMHVKESVRNLNGRNGILASHLPFGDHRRGWDFVSPGRGGVPFEHIFRALNDVGYKGPLSVEWEDNGMNRDQGAPEARGAGAPAGPHAIRRGLRRGVCVKGLFDDQSDCVSHGAWCRHCPTHTTNGGLMGEQSFTAMAGAKADGRGAGDRRRHVGLRLHGQGAPQRLQEAAVHDVPAGRDPEAGGHRRPQRGGDGRGRQPLRLRDGTTPTGAS